LMGYSIAKAAAKEDAEVILISTENFEEIYENLKIKKVKTANEMRSASLTLYDEADVFIMAAAVADYRPEKKFTKKVKKENIENLCINLVKNPDILMELGKNKKTQFLVGFAAETNNLIENGLKKLKNKNLDMLIANDVTQSGAGFESKTNIVSVIYKDGKIDSYPKMSKIELGEILINKISSALE
ncbi:MAG: phosphopantothenoylcysteine decarboxylase, partial [Dialister micraerophilus]|nr:phosphopantothenoylcysteine decarboxylase [Dialister micraerophilus]